VSSWKEEEEEEEIKKGKIFFTVSPNNIL